MEKKIEGIVLSKIPYKEKDSICSLLLRNGKKISVLFFGGRTGTSNKRRFAVSLEIGYVIHVVLHHKRQFNYEEDFLFSAKEWSFIWTYKKVRLHHLAHLNLCFFLEILKTVSVTATINLKREDHDEDHDHEQVGVFRVGSNALFYLEQSVVKNNFVAEIHFLIFLIKLLYELGVAPQVENCILCQKKLIFLSPVFLCPLEGGFACHDCFLLNQNGNKMRAIDDRELLFLVKKLAHFKYENYEELDAFIGPPGSSAASSSQIHFRTILNYFCRQFHLDQSRLRTLKFIGLVDYKSLC